MNELLHILTYWYICLMAIVYCPRNELPVISLGDKSYQVPEYSRDFHKHGSSRPTVSFG